MDTPEDDEPLGGIGGGCMMFRRGEREDRMGRMLRGRGVSRNLFEMFYGECFWDASK